MSDVEISADTTFPSPLHLLLVMLWLCCLHHPPGMALRGRGGLSGTLMGVTGRHQRAELVTWKRLVHQAEGYGEAG